MIIQHPIDPNSVPSLEPFDVPTLFTPKFKFKGNSWYNCPFKINAQLDKAINYRQKIIALKFPFINDQLTFNLQTFKFTNSNETILGYIRWIPKIILIDEQNTNKITYLDNFKPMVRVDPIIMISKHQKYINNTDDKSLTGGGEHEMTDDVDDDSFYSSGDSHADHDDEHLTDQKKVNSQTFFIYKKDPYSIFF